MSVFVTAEIAQAIKLIIDEHHTGFVALMYGEQSVPEEDWQRAIDLGIIDPEMDQETLAANLYSYGVMMSHEDQANWQDRYGDTTESFLEQIEKNPVPMTMYEHHAQQASNAQAGQYIVGLGNKVGATLGSKLIEADAALDKELRSTIRDVISARYGDNDAARRMRERAIAGDIGEDPGSFFDDSFRSSIGRMTSDMGHATQDWSRDLKRIANTENQRAHHKGLSDGWQERAEEQAVAEDAPIVRVIAYKIAKPDACKHCQRLHNDNSGFPRLFYLDNLEGNGSNYGKKTAAWQATVDPVHPWCACALVRLPNFVHPHKGWRSGQSAPSVVGPGGSLVIPDE
jgi:hypothetical protein